MDNSPQKLQKQKGHLEEYKELITAMFKIKDRKIQLKILDVLNEASTDKNSKTNRPVIIQKQFTDKSIQTDDIVDRQNVPENIFTVAQIRELNKQTQTCEKDFYKLKDSESIFNLSLVKKEPKSEIISGLPIREKGRNKKVNIPHAKKSVPKKSGLIDGLDGIYSWAEIKPNKRLSKSNRATSPVNQFEEESNKSFSDVEETLANNLNLTNDMPPLINVSGNSTPVRLPTFNIKNEMQMDLEMCNRADEQGFLPLHIAARDSDEILLRRNCMALKYRFNDINWLTFSGENALHVAVSHNSSLGCIQTLLDFGGNVLEETEDGDNVLHLSAKYCKNIQVFRLLLRTVPLDKLTKFNFDGKAVLHLIIEANKFSFVREFIEYVDEKLEIETIGKDIKSEDELMKIYYNHIMSYITTDRPKIKLNKTKMKLLNQKCMKTGRTPLLLAAESDLSESLCILFLSHGADPRIEDLSGLSCFTFVTDVLGNKKIAMALYNTDCYLKWIENEMPVEMKMKQKIFYDVADVSVEITGKGKLKKATGIISGKRKIAEEKTPVLTKKKRLNNKILPRTAEDEEEDGDFMGF